MLEFIETIPVIPRIVFEQCCPFFDKVRDMGLIGKLTLLDILNELKERTLSEDVIIKLLKW